MALIFGADIVAEKCDLFTGDWLPDPSGPFYTNESCHVIPEHQNCMKNGRPDSGYLYWRWNPRNCDLPRFNPEKFLDLMRNKSWGFIGDSISRNHVQSLLCILSQVRIPNKETLYLEPIINIVVAILSVYVLFLSRFLKVRSHKEFLINSFYALFG